MRPGTKAVIVMWFGNLALAIFSLFMVFQTAPFSDATWWVYTWHIFWAFLAYGGLSNTGFVFGIFSLIGLNSASKGNWLNAGSAGVFAYGDYIGTKAIYDGAYRKAERASDHARYKELLATIDNGQWYLLSPGEKTGLIWEMYSLQERNGYSAPYEVFRSKLSAILEFEDCGPHQFDLDHWQEEFGEFPEWFKIKHPELVRKTKYYGQL
jgi:hypothetical protein